MRLSFVGITFAAEAAEVGSQIEREADDMSSPFHFLAGRIEKHFVFPPTAQLLFMNLFGIYNT